MTKTGYTIKDVVIGSAFRITRTYTGLPTGVTISTVYLTVKRNLTDADADALVSISITTTLGANGQITDADTTGGSIAMYFNVSESASGAATVDTYWLGVDVETTENGSYNRHTLERSKIVFIDGVRD